LWQVCILSDVDRSERVCRVTKRLIAQIEELWAQLVHVHEEAEEYFRLQPDSRKIWRNYFENHLLRDQDTRVFIALEDKQVLGFLVARIEPPTPLFAGNYFGFLSDTYVRPEYRHQGIMQALYRSAADWLACQGIYELQLDVYNRNHTAWEYWNKQGFRPLKTRMIYVNTEPEQNIDPE
jgi:ribosomal protein S18 acetylase RimI-like enzyme